MLGNPLVRFCEGWGGNLPGVPHLLDPGVSPGVKETSILSAPEGRQKLCRPSGAQFLISFIHPGLTPGATICRRFAALFGRASRAI